MIRLTMIAIALSALAAGCFSPKYGNGDLMCAAGGSCPKGFYCADDNRCYQTGFTPDLATGGANGDMGPTITLAPPAPAWTAAAGGSASAAISGSQLGVSMGGSIVNGTSTAASGATITFGYFSSDTY